MSRIHEKWIDETPFKPYNGLNRIAGRWRTPPDPAKIFQQKPSDFLRVQDGFCLFTGYFDYLDDYQTDCQQHHKHLIIAHKAPPPNRLGSGAARPPATPLNPLYGAACVELIISSLITRGKAPIEMCQSRGCSMLPGLGEMIF